MLNKTCDSVAGLAQDCCNSIASAVLWLSNNTQENKGKHLLHLAVLLSKGVNWST